MISLSLSLSPPFSLFQLISHGREKDIYLSVKHFFRDGDMFLRPLNLHTTWPRPNLAHENRPEINKVMHFTDH